MVERKVHSAIESAVVDRSIVGFLVWFMLLLCVCVEVDRTRYALVCIWLFLKFLSLCTLRQHSVSPRVCFFLLSFRVSSAVALFSSHASWWKEKWQDVDLEGKPPFCCARLIKANTKRSGDSGGRKRNPRCPHTRRAEQQGTQATNTLSPCKYNRVGIASQNIALHPTRLLHCRYVCITYLKPINHPGLIPHRS